MKRLTISAFAAVALLVAATILRPYTPSVARSAGVASLQGLHAAADISKLPIEEFDDQSLVFTKTTR